MRIIYIDAKITHINPTANLIPQLFREISSEVYYFGPGYTDDIVLDYGIEKFFDHYGPFDVAILGSGMPIFSHNNDDICSAVEFQMKYSAHKLTKKKLINFYTDVINNFNCLDKTKKIAAFLNYDYYAATQNQIEYLQENSISVLCPNDQFITSLTDLPEFAKKEKHYIRKIEKFTDVWKDFLVKNPERVVTATHFVGPSEFVYSPLSLRNYDVSVPGAEYVLRKKAIEKLSSKDFEIAPKKYFHLYRLASKFGLPAYSNSWALNKYHLLFKKTLADSRITYTAKGGFGMPIRKFFEIPAAGSLLLCSPCNGYHDLGFQDGKHYIHTEPEDLIDVMREWLSNHKAQEVANAGQQLVSEKHSLTARSKQVEACLKAMVAGVYEGARWCGGEFVVQKRKKCAD